MSTMSYRSNSSARTRVLGSEIRNTAVPSETNNSASRSYRVHTPEIRNTVVPSETNNSASRSYRVQTPEIRNTEVSSETKNSATRSYRVQTPEIRNTEATSETNNSASRSYRVQTPEIPSTTEVPSETNNSARRSYRSYTESDIEEHQLHSERMNRNARCQLFALHEEFVQQHSGSFNTSTAGFEEADYEDNLEDDTEKPDDEREKGSAVDLDEREPGPLTINSEIVELAYESLKKECAALRAELESEKRAAILLKPRYEYLETHFKEYVRRREEYRRLSERIESKGAASETDKQLKNLRLESQSKETQTWKGIICSYCSKTYEIANNKTFKDFVDWQTKSTFCVSRSTFQELEDRFKAVVAAIKERESIYENRTEKAQVINLKGETASLKSQIAQLLRKNKHGQNCLEILQRIIIKLMNDGEDPYSVKLTEREQHWIQRILSKAPELMSVPDESVSVTPSAIDFSRLKRSRSCTYSNMDPKSAAGDF